MGQGATTQTFYGKGLVFTLSPDRTIVRTSLQTFFLVPRESYWYKRINLVRAMIQLGQVQDLNDLAEFCGDGIEWRMTGASIDALVHNERAYGRTEQN